MPAKAQPQDLEDLLGELARSADGAGAKVSVEEIVDSIGRRSFGPLLLVAGLLGMTPVSAVPGAPTTIAIASLLVSLQLVFGRKTVWLPRFLLKLSVDSARLKKTVKLACRPARVVDRLVRPRLEALTRPVADRLVALACAILAALIPPLELLPFVAFFPAAAIAMFGLALIARDGVLVLVGLAISVGALGFAGYRVFG